MLDDITHRLKNSGSLYYAHSAFAPSVISAERREVCGDVGGQGYISPSTNVNHI